MPHTLKPALGENDHVRGELSAPIQLVEFGDFECPFCGRAFPILRSVEVALAERLCFGFRPFPLTPLHPHALLAAEAAEAAGAQGSFWEMHDTLFMRQDALTLPDVVEYAQELELDVSRFIEELRGHVYLPKIRAELGSGAVSGVNGTPTLFINGERWDQPVELDPLMEALMGGPSVGREL